VNGIEWRLPKFANCRRVGWFHSACSSRNRY